MAGFGVDRGSGSSSGNPDSAISESLIDAKGDLIVGTADNTAARVAVGADETRLVAASAEAAGVKWVADSTNYLIAAAGDIIYGTAADTAAALSIGAAHRRLAVNAGATAPEWVADTQNTVVTTKGDILVATANRTVTRLAVGSDGQGLVADSSQSEGIAWSDVPTNTSPHRQTQLSGALDSSGYNATLSAGSGLNFDVAATTTNAIYTFAGGFNAAGASDLVTVLSADASDQGSLNVSNTHYIHATRSSATAVTWGQTLVPPQYGYAFDRGAGAILNFEDSDGSTTILDDFGNTWSVGGNAQIDTAQSKFGSSSLLLDGTGDYVTTSGITSFGPDSWSAELWVRFNALPGSGVSQTLLHAHQASADHGVQLQLNNTAGTTRLQLSVSSNASSFDVINGSFGSTTSWSTGVWYKVRLAYDALGGTYRLYLSNAGAAESQELSTSSTARTCSFTAVRIGALRSGSNPVNGWIDGVRIIRCATATSTETPAAAAPDITDYPVHFFSIPAMTMYEVTAASVSAGVDPTLTARTRLFVGEADTDASSVTEVRNYALRGKYESGLSEAHSAGTAVSMSHNIGVVPQRLCFVARFIAGGSGYYNGDEFQLSNDDNATSCGTASAGRLTAQYISTTTLVIAHKTTGARAGAGSLCRLKLYAERGW